MPKQLLVGMLYHEEAEFPRALAALKNQRGVTFDHFVVEGLPNMEAHDTLYATFMKHSSEHDYSLKLDADMILRGDTALQAMLNLIKPNNSAHLMLYVMDWASQLKIPGIQMFRRDVRWPGSNDRLNVDYSPAISGPSIVVTEAELVDHMPDPSRFQAFRYGMHKAFKSLQPDRRDKDYSKGLLHAVILAGIARHWRANRDVRLGLALAGAARVFTGSARHLMHDYAGQQSKQLFNSIEADYNLDALLKRVDASWGTEIQFFMRWHEWVNKTVWN